MIAYFVRGCEDKKYRIFKCDIEISTNFVNLSTGKLKKLFDKTEIDDRLMVVTLESKSFLTNASVAQW